MEKSELETYLKVEKEAFSRAERIFSEKIKTSPKQYFEGVEIGEDIFTVHWSEPSCGEWEDFYEHFPTELLLLDEEACMGRIDEIQSERARRKAEVERQNELKNEEIRKHEDIITLHLLADKYGFKVSGGTGEDAR